MHFPVHLAMRIYSLDLSDLSDGRYPTKWKLLEGLEELANQSLRRHEQEHAGGGAATYGLSERPRPAEAR